MGNTLFKAAAFCSADGLPSNFIGINSQVFNLIVFCASNEVIFMTVLFR
jgi:hypothetical protein